MHRNIFKNDNGVDKNHIYLGDYDYGVDFLLFSVGKYQRCEDLITKLSSLLDSSKHMSAHSGRC